MLVQDTSTVDDQRAWQPSTRRELTPANIPSFEYKEHYSLSGVITHLGVALKVPSSLLVGRDEIFHLNPDSYQSPW